MFTRSSVLATVLLAAGVLILLPDARADLLPGPTPPAATVASTPTAATAVEAAGSLADSRDGSEHFTSSLVDQLGYEPGSEGAVATNPEGDCSSPVPLPAAFESACRVHDLGYDLLRGIDGEGAAIPRELRSSLDERMTEHMHTSCSDEPRARVSYFGCRFMASVASVAVQLNTVRQGHGAPVEESFPW